MVRLKAIRADRLWGPGQLTDCKHPVRTDRYIWQCIAGPADLVNRLFRVTDINYGWPDGTSSFKNILTGELKQSEG